MIRSASFLPMPGIDDQHRLVLLQDRELEVGGRPRADDRQRDLRADAGHRQQQVEEPELLGRAEPEQRLLVLAHEVVGVELQPARPGVAVEITAGEVNTRYPIPPTSMTSESVDTAPTTPSTEAITARVA